MLPGISVGATISTSVPRVDKSKAARFFLMVVPLILEKIATERRPPLMEKTMWLWAQDRSFIAGLAACTWMINWCGKVSCFHFTISNCRLIAIVYGFINYKIN
jgi:undecaprenyl pyrophosphate phosphatase UppP